jgi:flagellar motor protein MotB
MVRVSTGAIALLLLGAGCVPLTDYRKLEDRYKEQEKYVQKHKDEMTEFQRREQLLTCELKEREKSLELSNARLAKSEILRRQLEAANGKPIVVTEPMASSKTATDTTFAGFRINPDSGGIVLEHDVLFETAKHTLKESGKKILGEIASKLNTGEYARYCIRIDGHTDDQPVVKSAKENHDNWELGFKRAKAVLDFLVSKGIKEDRCFLASFSCFRPFVGEVHAVKHSSKKGEKHEKHDGARSQNRRVEIVVFEKK